MGGKYPDDWLGPESVANIINYPELTKLVKANGLDSGHLSHLIRSMQENVLGNIDHMLRERTEAAPKPQKEGE